MGGQLRILHIIDDLGPEHCDGCGRALGDCEGGQHFDPSATHWHARVALQQFDTESGEWETIEYEETPVSSEEEIQSADPWDRAEATLRADHDIPEDIEVCS